MDRLMRVFAPRGAFGFAVRLFFLICVVGAANITFAWFFDSDAGHPQHDIGYYLLHATIVGGPLIAFFLAVTVFQVRLQRKLWQLSRKDGLTGIDNRRTFFDLTTKAMAHQKTGVLMMLDADWFKRINDTYGHQAGDNCLKSIAYTLRRNIRQEDILGRLGGEEFAIYLKGASIEHARVIGERLTRPITFQTEGEDCLSVTLSVGAVLLRSETSIDALFAQADAALYHAKKNGRAKFVLWEPGLQRADDPLCA